MPDQVRHDGLPVVSFVQLIVNSNNSTTQKVELIIRDSFGHDAIAIVGNMAYFTCARQPAANEPY
jgi:hypothetical protein